METTLTDKIQLAADFVNSTSRHIFLTGKAGTGKTTFLRSLATATHKSHIIVAPTGIAALNAGGVTIHSQFLLPFGSFLPDPNSRGVLPEESRFYNAFMLRSKRRNLDRERLKVLRGIDLLIIDEVSMLRADLLDAIDLRLRTARGNHLPFGGVQLLMIGDLYQLPPIVKEDEQKMLEPYYPSPFFFHSLALKKAGYVYIELDKIFRQQDDKFIGLLNNLRNDCATPDDLELLNSHYKPNYTPEENEDIITLTTHNYQADEINKRELARLPGPSSYFEAEVEGNFPDSMFPVATRLELKVGAQIMFIKNDNEGKKYYNGKLARVSYIDEDGITVLFPDTREQYILKKEVWENKRMVVNENQEVSDEVVGTFEQYPVKLAWAITVHKSQGLTFDKAMIDVGRAFAAGQVYVALSRLRSLDGLILRTKVQPEVISSDRNVVVFSKNEQEKPSPALVLKQHQKEYLQGLLFETFDFSPLRKEVEFALRNHNEATEFEDPEMQQALPELSNLINTEVDTTAKFRRQLSDLLDKEDEEKLLERVEKGASYYSDFMWKTLRHILLHMADVSHFSGNKSYVGTLSTLDQMLMKKLTEIDKVAYLARCIINGETIEKLSEQDAARYRKRANLITAVEEYARLHPKQGARKTGRKRTGKAPAKKGETYEITYGMLEKGMTPEQVAEKRDITVGTVYSHISRGIRSGKLDVQDYLEPEALEIILAELNQSDDLALGPIFHKLDEKYPYHILRLVKASMDA